MPHTYLTTASTWKADASIKSNSNGTAFCVLATRMGVQEVTLTNESVKAYEKSMKECTWPDFTSFSECITSMWEVKFNKEDWTSSTCSCPVFQKQYYCKHWLGVALRKKLITLSPTPGSTVIMVKPTRGRPADTEYESQRPARYSTTIY